MADEDGGFEARHERNIKEKMDEWKRNYYRGKLEISFDDPKEMGDLIYRYVEGLQWVMHYYYSGVASWGWFYNYHYAPRISDLRGIDHMVFSFDLGKPFKPFEQLMGVLPVASRDNIPLAYQDLMYDVNSPILDFYPTDFESDLNGKKQDWEAIVKIPFIDEKRLLKAMASREHRLSADEKKRNGYGPSTVFSYSADEPTLYPSSLPGFFPPLYRCTCKMEPFDLPTLDGLHLVPGLCDGVKIGVEALAGFPSLNTLPHSASLGFHGVNVHGSESRNKSMVVHIENPYEHMKTEDVAVQLIGERIFMNWPFLQEGKVVAVSDTLFKFEKISIIPGTPPKAVSTPHSPQGLGHWKMKAERNEQVYSKKCGVITGAVDVLLHVRPLKGLKRLEDGAFVKDYEDPAKEVEHAVQMCLTEVVSEDSRFLERAAPPLSEEFPEGTKIFFLGEHAYGVAAQVSSTSDSTLSVVLAFFPSEKSENDQFKQIVQNRSQGSYFPSFRVADLVGLSGRALSKITSSFMVITSDQQKTNLGLSLKFEAKALKVVDYSRKDGRHWEFSQKAVDLIKEYKTKFPDLFRCLDRGGDAMAKASDIFGSDADARVREIKSWLKSKGVRDFDPVSLFCDQLGKDTVTEIEQLADSFSKNKSSSAIKKAIVKGIPRQAVLKPGHAVYRLQNQHFGLGDRVTMVRDSGGVPLSVKGVVIGLNSKSMDVVWDVPFMSGVTLGDRCSQYRGSTVEFNSCLNLTNPQYVASTNPKAPPLPPNNNPPFNPKFGPHPAVRPAPGQAAASGFKPAPQSVSIMSNPNRNGRGMANGRGGPANGRGGHQKPAWTVEQNGSAANGGASTTDQHSVPGGSEAATENGEALSSQPDQAPVHNHPNGNTPFRGRPFHPRGFAPRGRGGFIPNFERGRGRGGCRGGRGRGGAPIATPSS